MNERARPADVLRGRYAPSPTGELHLGNASSALLAWLSVRSRGGRFVMRIEDLDRNRSRPEFESRLLADLAWFGIDWDEGPDRGGPHEPYRQWERRALYERALAGLRDQARVYPCFCSRRDVAAAANAPHAGEELRYAGTCRELPPSVAARRIAAGERHAWRFRVAAAAPPPFDDVVHGRRGDGATEPPGDFVVFNAEGAPAYQLAVVVDDAAMEIGEVVRGADLLDSTPRQILLQRALGLPQPAYGHVPLLLGPDGVRLSKRHRGITLRELREAGLAAEDVVGRLAGLLGLVPDASPLRPRDLVPRFALERLRPAADGIRVDPLGWARRGD